MVRGAYCICLHATYGLQVRFFVFTHNKNDDPTHRERDEFVTENEHGKGRIISPQRKEKR